MIRLAVTVDDITNIMAQDYTVIRVYTDTSSTGNFTTLDGTITLVAGQTGYNYLDLDGDTSTWYKTAYYGSTPGESSKSDAQQGGTVDAYATALDVRKELSTGSGNVSIGQENEDVIWDMLVEASRLIDQYKRVEPGAYDADDSETRYFAGSGMGYQRIDYAVSVSEVAVEETDGTYTVWTADTDYYTLPSNASAISEPIRALEVIDKSGTSKSVFTLGQQRVKVTGVFGISSAPPGAVARACKIQAAIWFKRAQQAYQETGVTAEFGELAFMSSRGTGSVGVRSFLTTLDPDVKVLLRSTFPHVGAGI